MNYDRINNKILELIEENYSKILLKTIKIIQIIIVSYKCSEHKSLKVFTDKGFETSIPPFCNGKFLDFYVMRRLTQKLCISVPMTKWLINNGLYFDYHKGTKGIIYIHIDETDNIYKYIKLLENSVSSITDEIFGNKAISYKIVYEGDKKYKLTVLYSAMMQ